MLWGECPAEAGLMVVLSGMEWSSILIQVEQLLELPLIGAIDSRQTAQTSGIRRCLIKSERSNLPEEVFLHNRVPCRLVRTCG